MEKNGPKSLFSEYFVCDSFYICQLVISAVRMPSFLYVTFFSIGPLPDSLTDNAFINLLLSDTFLFFCDLKQLLYKNVGFN